MTKKRLRPESWDDLTRRAVVRPLVTAAKGRQEQPDHVLLSGPPRLGKTAMASLILAEIGDGKRAYAGQSSAEITAELYSLDGGEAIFVDELHALRPEAAEVVQLAMEGAPIGGRFADPVPPWTLIGATTKLGQSEAPIREGFGLHLALGYYSVEDIAQIAQRSAIKLGVELQPTAAAEIASRSRGVPRIANRLLRRVRDVYDNPTPKQVNEVPRRAGRR